MYKLCGGTLFVLLLHSAKKFYPRKSEYYYLSDALKILYPELPFTRTLDAKITLNVAVNRFKKCNKNETSSFASVFCDDSLKNTLTANIEENYGKLLNRSEEYVKKFIETESDKDVLFVKAVIEVILNDEDISEETTFHISPDGQSVSKEELRSMNQFYLPSFLLGVLYYVMMNISDNWKGEDTYNEWCPPVSGKKERPYKANIGEKSSRNIELLPKPISEKEQPSKPDSTKSSTTHETFTLGPYFTKKYILTKDNILNLRPIIYKPSDIRNDNNEVLHVKCSSTHIPRENPPQIASNKKRLLLLSYIAIKNNLDTLIGLYEEVRAEYFATYGNDFNTQLIDSYCKKISALKEQYCSSHHRLKNMYEELLRHFGDISLADNNIKQFFNITGKIIEYISIENILSKQFIFKDFVKLNRAFNYYYFQLADNKYN